MEPSGSLFPSLVVVGHVVTLAAVWHWRRGRRRVQDEQGKRRWRLPLARAAVTSHCPVQGGWRRGGGEGPPPCHPCIALSPPLPVPELSSSTWSESSVAPTCFPGAEPHSGQMGRREAGGGLPTGAWAMQGCPPGREAPPQLPETGSPGDCQHRNRSWQVQVSWDRTEVELGLGRASRPLREVGLHRDRCLCALGQCPGLTRDGQPGCTLPSPCPVTHSVL